MKTRHTEGTLELLGAIEDYRFDMLVFGGVDLPKGRDGVRLSRGSAKRPGKRNHRDSPEYASGGRFYRVILHSYPLVPLVQNSSVEGLVRCWDFFITLADRKVNDSLIY